MTHAGAQTPYDLVLKGGRVIDERNGRDGTFDVAIKAGKIAAVASAIDPQGGKVRDVSAAVAPGLSTSTPMSTTRRLRSASIPASSPVARPVPR